MRRDLSIPKVKNGSISFLKVIKVKLRSFWGEICADQDPLITFFSLICNKYAHFINKCKELTPSRLPCSNKHDLSISIVKNDPVLFL